MATITGTKESLISSPGGMYAILTITATAESASDDIVLTQATHGITGITSILGATITGGQDAAFTAISCSASSLTLTLVSVEEDGTGSSSWTDTTVTITVLGTL